ncbi:class I SAM-dependent methyltransferase [Plantactinospora sp. KBS50]|uniref:class I SAM-dependent methyltransferase n=1 Tax=Plantactinospora sp. KBS50 TaxID=2024580 RepID=UPI000BAAAC6D|nr:class I SAM-dependent methyltransferase [Plantactinospora sp. KBS50]ASW57576.1 SAM-dependent methyltransferase [Plantactinospora sp. KBS50]
MTIPLPPDFAAWLDLREPADAAARSAELAANVRRRLAGRGPLTIHDLGSGTGSMARWLAPLLPGPQHWLLYDQDADLLAHAARHLPERAADGSPVTAETRQRDISRLDRHELTGAALVTGSALLDMLTADELARIVAACADAGCPVLFMISVTGGARLDPAEPLDAEIAAAFDEHQRRTVAGRALLGPDAARACAAAFAARGLAVRLQPSPWHLGPNQAPLIAEWFTGWLAAALEQRPELAAAATAYAQRRLAAAAAGRLRVLVPHTDLLAAA